METERRNYRIPLLVAVHCALGISVWLSVPISGWLALPQSGLLAFWLTFAPSARRRWAWALAWLGLTLLYGCGGLLMFFLSLALFSTLFSCGA